MFKKEGKNWEIEVLPKEHRLKSVYLAYVIYLIFGMFGLHHFYLRQMKRGVAYLALCISPIIIAMTGPSHQTSEIIFYGAWGVLTFLLIIDLFTLVGQVNYFNNKHFTSEERKTYEL